MNYQYQDEELKQTKSLKICNVTVCPFTNLSKFIIDTFDGVQLKKNM